VRRVGARVGLVVPPDLPPSERLLALERDSGRDRVLLLPCDAGDTGALRAALAEVRHRLGPVRGAFWTGGAFAGGLFQLATPDSLRHALEPAARGADALLSALDSLHSEAGAEPPGFAALFSTTPAVTGGLGQLEVAAAGAYLEAVAARRAARDDGRSMRTLAVHWDPYQWGGWLVAGVGGAMAGVSSDQVQADLAAHGVAEERSAAAFERLLASPLGSADTAAVLVTARDLHGLIAEIDSVTAEVLMGQMTHGPKAERPALATPYEPPRDDLEEKLVSLWQELFGIEPIGRDDSFLELGGHSLLAIQVVTQLKRVLDVDLPVTALFEAPTVAQLGKALRRARGEADPEQMEALLAMIEGLSPEEAAARLAELEVSG
jgi:acyl carrier protein